ncbi:hypothetical protein FA13DRAFT_1729046 [Coprinellus micaceus]|uniref:Secreted protein n=1 Tax=Coprinellus micaceus TaxID=71717 RepID=A0A4Y7TLZ4_COPMI|nr:hypothetical protein FA13DRAFT_1729046 [Coprinellus micaceus]
MIFSLASTLFALVSVALAAPSLSSRAVAAPTNFTISSLGYSGTGCPSGTAHYVLSNDRTKVDVVFDRLYAEAGPGIAANSNRRNCALTFGVNVPPGFTFGVASVGYKGFYKLDSAVTANQQSLYYFQSQINQATARSTLTGPIGGAEYSYRDSFDLVSTVLSPCGASTVLIVNSEVRVSNSGNTKGYGYIATDTLDTSLTQTLNFQWQTCK